jgi:hypothetical protein
LATILNHLPYRLMALGDDNCTLTSRIIAKEMQAAQLGSLLGMKEKIAISSLDDADFLSANFVPARVGNDDTYVLTAKLGRTLTKTFYRRPQYLTPQNRVRYALGILQATVLDHSHIKWFRILAQQIIKAYPNVQPDAEYVRKLKNSSYRGFSEETFTRCPEEGFYLDFIKNKKHEAPPRANHLTRPWYLKHYDITEGELASFEAYVSRAQHYNVILDHPVLDRIVETDLGLPPGAVLDQQRPLPARDHSLLVGPKKACCALA